MAERFIHTVHKNGVWLNEIEDGDEISGSFLAKEAAVERGRLDAIDANTEHVIHNKDGTIGERNS